MIFLKQFSANSALIHRLAIVHRDHLIDWTKVFCRVAVAIQTPPHVEFLSFPRQRHLVDPAVTSGTADTFRHVNAVIEVHVSRQIVNPSPLDRLAGLPALPHRLQNRSILPDLRMTRHARFDRRQAGESAFFHSGVAIPAINPQTAGVMLVAEWHRLLLRNLYFGPKIGSSEAVHNRTCADSEERHTGYSQPSDRICSRSKELRHRNSPRPRALLIQSRTASIGIAKQSFLASPIFCRSRPRSTGRSAYLPSCVRPLVSNQADSKDLSD